MQITELYSLDTCIIMGRKSDENFRKFRDPVKLVTTEQQSQASVTIFFQLLGMEWNRNWVEYWTSIDIRHVLIGVPLLYMRHNDFLT